MQITVDRFWVLALFFCWGTFGGEQLGQVGTEPLLLHTRARQASKEKPDEFRIVEQTTKWAPRKTAIIICDMWDKHWCKGATARVAEMAPHMNDVLKAARQRGVLIIHAPSETMKFYAEYSQRKYAQSPPKAAPSADAARWKSLNRDKEPPLPIDDSDGGCDDTPQCAQGGPWRSQIASLEIFPGDVISDSGEEIYNVLQQRDIENVIVMGVHTNMCVLGRPFSIRSMVGLGKNVVLMRDMTDTMYNSRRSPYVSHFAGTDLVVEHIEKYWCPSITSADFLGGEPFRFKADHRKIVAFIIGENEYHTWETLPDFAGRDLDSRGYRSIFVTSTPDANDQEFKDYRRITEADVLVVSARRRTPRREMLDLIRQHLAAGKALIGIRTASHAFAGKLPDKNGPNNTTPPEYGSWPEFDAEVLGGNYTGHYDSGPKTIVTFAPPVAQVHPVLTGVDPMRLTSTASLYITSPLKTRAQVLLLGAIPDKES